MSKWMKGCLVILALVALAMWWGYRKMVSVAAGPAPMVTINAPASRVFASLANADSLSTWMARGNKVVVSRHGLLVQGDTIAVQPTKAFGGRMDRIRWVVSSVIPDRLLALEVRDSTGVLAGTRRDSLITDGATTRVISNVTVSIPDSLARGSKSDSANAGAMLNMTSRMMFSAFRMESQLDLTRLKNRIENRK
ncbi:MAG TPA: hypothetical protein VM099_09050 [Gemmatimonadaceae bacterium]|nr:hypothetical protein [Gemmatimonadaceae bacterium]